ncbi:MAG: putative drug exporter of the superfamily [Pseudonocardiales bacterium]|nr:putative drug exporter of the superfamily [Pseudonocardiales bacterium]
MLTRIADLAIRAPKRILVIAGLLLVGGGIFGAPVAGHLLTGGFTDPAADSTRATSVIDAKFHGGQANLVFLVTAKGGVNSTAARTTGTQIESALARRTDWVTFAQSYWSSPPGQADGLRSKDGRYGLVVTHIKGNDNEIQVRSGELAAQLSHGVGGASVQAGGAALAYHQVNDQTKRDLAVAEAIAVPLTAIALILVFGSLIAALVPLAIGIFSIIETLAILRSLSTVTDVSIYAMNMTTALGLALAIDYSLFMVSRYREELAAGRDPHDAIVATVRTSGRTVLFSAVTVGLSLSAMIVFPMYFLRSFAYAGLAVVALAAVASIVVLPACLALIGTRVNALDLRAALRRAMRRPERQPKTLEQGLWYRLAGAVMRRPATLGITVTAIFVLLGSPFLRAQFGYPDDRIINSGASARAVGDVLRTDFSQDASAGLVGVVDAASATSTEVNAYTTAVSTIHGVKSVTSPAGTFVAGKQVGPPQPALRSVSGQGALFNVATDVDPFSTAGKTLVHDLRGQPAPWKVLYSGAAAFNVDAMSGLGSKLPLAFGLIALATFVVLFLFTGSVVVPIKALVLNMLSLSATFGAMVWVFQEGHLSGLLGFTPTGYLVANMVILMFCLAFGMSMDYEVFLLSRIREEWVNSDRTDAANRRAVSLGLARTGRIVTAAAALMAIVFAAMVGSKVAFMQLFGLGLTLAVLADATLVRGILVPAFMRLMGRRNWWAPAPLVRLHDRFGLSEVEPAPPSTPRVKELNPIG